MTTVLKALLRDGVSDSLSGLARRTGLSQHTVAVEVRNLAAAGLVKHRDRVDWPTLREEARRRKLKSELVALVELAADASGHAGLRVHVEDLRDHRRRSGAASRNRSDPATPPGWRMMRNENGSGE